MFYDQYVHFLLMFLCRAVVFGRRWFLPPLRDAWSCLETFGCHSWRKECFWGPVGEWRILLNILCRTGQPHSKELSGPKYCSQETHRQSTHVIYLVDFPVFPLKTMIQIKDYPVTLESNTYFSDFRSLEPWGWLSFWTPEVVKRVCDRIFLQRSAVVLVITKILPLPLLP